MKLLYQWAQKNIELRRTSVRLQGLTVLFGGRTIEQLNQYHRLLRSQTTFLLLPSEMLQLVLCVTFFFLQPNCKRTGMMRILDILTPTSCIWWRWRWRLQPSSSKHNSRRNALLYSSTFEKLSCHTEELCPFSAGGRKRRRNPQAQVEDQLELETSLTGWTPLQARKPKHS